MYWRYPLLPLIGGAEMMPMNEMHRMMGHAMMNMLWHMVHFEAKHLTRYVVQSGDTLADIARTFGVRPEDIRFWNHLHGDHLRPGTLVTIPAPMVARPPMGH